MAVQLTDIIILCVLILMGMSNLLCMLAGAYIAWRCKENKPLLPLTDISVFPAHEAEKMNEKRYKKILEEGSTEI